MPRGANRLGVAYAQALLRPRNRLLGRGHRLSQGSEVAGDLLEPAPDRVAAVRARRGHPLLGDLAERLFALSGQALHEALVAVGSRHGPGRVTPTRCQRTSGPTMTL